jgi:hypothetical protein
VLVIALAAGGCQPARPDASPPAAQARQPAPARPVDGEAERLGIDLAIAFITAECEDPAVRRQALRTRDAVLERTRILTQADRRRGELVWAEAEATMGRQSTRPRQAECEQAMPTLRSAEQMARSGQR